MLLQKIRLKGFLGHRSRPEHADSDDGFTEIDLSAARLWLIHGPNGGGKSSIWDAVTFALFKEHRGGSQNFAKLVNDADDIAEIRVEFIIDGELYMIKGIIKRLKQDGESAKVRRSLWQWAGSDWVSKYESEKKVKQWVDEHVRMSYETFCSAVLLRQGEADRFINTKPKERRDCLMELLQLDFYRILGEKADKRKNLCSADLKRCEKALEDLNPPTTEQIEEQRQLVGEAEELVSRTGEQVEEKRAELADAERAADLTAKIELARRQQQKDEAVLAEADSIEHEARLYRELDTKVLPRLDSLWAVRERLTREERALAKAERDAASLTQDLTALSGDLETLRQEENRASLVLESVEIAFRQASERQQQLQGDLTNLAHIEDFENDIRSEEERLKPYLPVLEERERIMRDYQRLNELREAEPLLERLNTAASNLAATRIAQEATRGDVESRDQQAQAASEEESRQRKTFIQAELEVDNAREAITQCEVKLAELRSKLGQREDVAEEDECPACGSRLDDEEARIRLAREIAHWQVEISVLDGEKKNLHAARQEKERARQNAQAALDSATQAAQEAKSFAGLARNNFEHARAALAKAEHEYTEAEAKAGAWSSRLSEFNDLKAELQKLAAAPASWDALEEARRIEDSVNSTIKSYRRRLEQLPRWSPEERQRIRAEAEECEHETSNLKRQEEEAERAHRDVRYQRAEAEGQHHKLVINLSASEREAEGLQQRVKEAKAEFELGRADVPQKYQTACDDTEAHDELRSIRDRLQGAEEKEEGLRAAYKRRDELAGEIKAHSAELDPIPTKRRRPVEYVREELDSANHALEAGRMQLRDVERRLAEIASLQAAAERAQQERDKAAQEFSYYKRLADAFGKHNLQALIVQSAQENIRRHANAILGGLTGNAWRVDLKENEARTELEIQARDLTQPGTPCRPFEYLSGGEQFRVAVSLAVAIGQSVVGGRAADTLVIDEGFGTLDQNNRGLLVKELWRLSDDALSGGRVVVVSHQEDVCGDFSNRYRVSKDADGYVQIDRHALT
jgi:exonuclease SbcC